MKEEYSNYFGKECKVINKTYDFIKPNLKSEISRPIKIVYMGNVGAGRWQIILKVPKTLSRINVKNKLAELEIYTSTPLSKKVINKLNILGTSSLRKPVPNSEVKNIMDSADILLHSIPTKRKFYLQEKRISFSTKVVDYFYSGRCILCVGGKTATMEYLRENDSAIIVDSDIESKLYDVLTNPETIVNYGKKAWECGIRNHQRKKMQKSIYNDFYNIVQENRRRI